MFVTRRVWKLECITCELGRRPMLYSSRWTSRGFGSRIRNLWMKPTRWSPNRQKHCWCVPCRTEKAASCAAAETAIICLLGLCVHPVCFIVCCSFYLSRWSIALQWSFSSDFDADVCAFVSGSINLFWVFIMHLFIYWISSYCCLWVPCNLWKIVDMLSDQPFNNIKLKDNIQFPLLQTILNLITILFNLKNLKMPLTLLKVLCYQLLKHLPLSSLKLLLSIFNHYWTTVTFPNIGIMLLGKGHTNPTNYHPMALTSCLCKIFEDIFNVGSTVQPQPTMLSECVHRREL